MSKNDLPMGYARIMKLRLLTVISIALLVGCSTTSKLVKNPHATTTVVSSETTVLILPPKITFEKIENELPLNPSEHGSAQIQTNLSAVARSVIQTNGLRLVGLDNGMGDATAKRESWFDLASHSDRLLSSTTNETMVRLRELAGADQHLAVLVQYLRVKVGPGAFWDPNSGAIASSMSSSHFRAALIDGQSGRVLWQDQVYIRDLPRLQTATYKKAVKMLYDNFRTSSKP